MGPKLKKEMYFEEDSEINDSVKILLVEDNPGDVVLIKEFLASTGINFSIESISTLRDTLLFCAEHTYDIILLDLGLPDSTGIETLKKIQVFNIDSPVIVMTGLDDEDIALESLRYGAQDYLVKNRLTSDVLLRGIKYGIERKKIQNLLNRNARRFYLLSSTTTAINDCEDISAVYEVAGQNISILLGTAGTVAIEPGNPSKFHISGTEYIKSWTEPVQIATGLNFQDSPLRIRDLRKEVSSFFKDGKLHKISYKYPAGRKGTDSKNSSTERRPEIIISAIGFRKSDKAYGGVLIFSFENLMPDDISIIETLCTQVSQSVSRRIAERELKASEARFRKLNRELEVKVRERTRDLETSNYNLRQELIQRHIAEQSLRKSEASLKELNDTKDKFFSIIAHDLKNPFTCLIGSIDLLNESISQKDLKKISMLVQILSDSALGGYAILQNLFDWSRTQTGTIPFRPEKINLTELIDSNISDLNSASEGKGIYVKSELTQNIYIHADKSMMNTVLRNLLSNAIKYTPKCGDVTISAKSQGNFFTVSVRDTGIGIPQEIIDDLFNISKKFIRPGTNMESGTGLGLILSKEFIELHKGKVWVNSAIDKGSEFIFTIPVKEIS